MTAPVDAVRQDPVEDPTPVEASTPIVACVFVEHPAINFAVTARSLVQNGLDVVIGARSPAVALQLKDEPYPTIIAPGPAEFVAEVWRRQRSHVLLAVDAVTVPAGLLDVARRWIEADLRVGSVSFLSNIGSIVSFPYINMTLEVPFGGHDETSLTRLLRTSGPPAKPTVVPHAAGPLVLFTASALGAVGPPVSPPRASPAAMIAEYSFRARRRGFVDLLDASTYVTCSSDLRVHPTLVLDREDRRWVFDRHPYAAEFVDAQIAAETPLWRAIRVSIAKATGLRVLVDGSCFGPHQMGTQVATLHLIDSLADRDDVAEIGVALVRPIPEYAARVLGRNKVRPTILETGALSAMGRFDIGHQPFQPGSNFDIAEWRRAADRVLVTFLDLIAYHAGSYVRDPDEWRRYRGTLDWVASCADGITVISDDVAEQVRLHQLPIDSERLFVNYLGTEHLVGTEDLRPPRELIARGLGAEDFLLCLGTNYSHKNRDLAIVAHRELVRRGYPLRLVLAGPAVLQGSSRLAEIQLGPLDDSVYMIPDVTEAERNWLLRHAVLVLYPTSAEGFGLIPYEAARFGTPTVTVGFGPLRGFAEDGLVTATDWNPSSIADAAERLISDPELARHQVEATVGSGAPYTWETTAESLVEVYRQLLALPVRSYSH